MSRQPPIEAFLRAFHARAPGWTARAFARGGTYALTAAAVPSGRVLELGCGDGALLARLPGAGIGIDLSLDELRGVAAPVACARAQALPFGDAVFDAVVSHLVLPVIPELDPVIAEAARVLRPGGRFVALIGGGPGATADAFEAFAALAGSRAPSMTDPRLRSTRAIAALLDRFDAITQTDHDIDLSGSFDEVWATLSAQYATSTDADRAALRARFPGARVPCTMHVRLVTALRR